MSLNETDKKAVKLVWDKLSKCTEAAGADVLVRMFNCHPQTKTYFSHWKDLSPCSDDVKKHGKTILEGVGLAVANINDMNKGLLDLSEKHAFQLRVDPANFKLMAQCIMVVMANRFPNDFTAEVHMSVDKFLVCLANALSERFR